MAGRRDRAIWAALAGAALGFAYAYGRRATRAREAAFPPFGRHADTSGGLRLHFAEAGDGSAQPVVLVHGADGVLQDFPAPLVERLAAEHRVIAFDRPGHGYSDPVRPGTPPLAVQADSLREAVARLGAERPIVIGHSYGGALALRWALDHPGELRALVLVAPAAYFAWPQWSKTLFAFVASPPGRGLARLLVPLGWPVLLAASARAFWPQPMPYGQRRHASAMSLRPAQFAALAEEYRWLADDLAAMSERYAELRLPVEIVAGDADRVTPSSLEAERLAREIPHRIPDAAAARRTPGALVARRGGARRARPCRGAVLGGEGGGGRGRRNALGNSYVGLYARELARSRFEEERWQGSSTSRSSAVTP